MKDNVIGFYKPHSKTVQRMFKISAMPSNGLDCVEGSARKIIVGKYDRTVQSSPDHKL